MKRLLWQEWVLTLQEWKIFFEDEISLNETYQDMQNNNYDVNDYENNEDNVYLPHQMPIEINIEEENENEENNIDENEENIDENINNIDTLVEELESSLDNEIEEINNMHDNENNNNINDDDNLQQEEKEENQNFITKYGREIKQNEMLNISDNNKQTHCNAQLTAKLMQQVSLREGLRRFGEEGNRAALAEMEQLHMRDTFKPVLPSNLTPEKKKEVLESIMLLKQKRDGTIKGRNCADGRKQREFTSEEEAASTTVKLESVFLTSVIEAHEGRDVTTVDIPNAFIQTKIENEADKVVMRMRGKLAEYLVLIAPQIYKPYEVFENGKKVLYCEAQNAIYGTLKAALLFYKKLLKDLIEFGFEINPYDVCVANKMINGKQMTTLFHVDDMKVSHMDSQEITIFINWLRTKYEVDGLNKLKATRDKVHVFLGMKLDFSKSGKVIIDMKEYVQNMINDFSVNLEDSSSNTPAGDWLFETRNNSKKLNDNMAQEFHTMVAKGLFLCKHARPDIQTTIVFLLQG